MYLAQKGNIRFNIQNEDAIEYAKMGFEIIEIVEQTISLAKLQALFENDGSVTENPEENGGEEAAEKNNEISVSEPGENSESLGEPETEEENKNEDQGSNEQVQEPESDIQDGSAV